MGLGGEDVPGLLASTAVAAAARVSTRPSAQHSRGGQGPSFSRSCSLKRRQGTKLSLGRVLRGQALK